MTRWFRLGWRRIVFACLGFAMVTFIYMQAKPIKSAVMVQFGNTISDMRVYNLKPYTVEERNEMRKKQVAEKCRKFPHLSNAAIDISVLKRLVVNDKYKIIWCNVPKVACTNWKRAFLILSGENKTEVLKMGRQSVHGKGFKTMAAYAGDVDGLQYRLKNYLKFVVVRDHWDRLLSCFRDKYANNSVNDPGFRGSAGTGSIRAFSKSQQPTFDGFLNFIVNDPKSLSRTPSYYPENEHWVQFYKLCNPCAIQYDVIGRYDTFTEDSNYILEKANITDIVGRFPEQRTPHEAKSKSFSKLSKIEKYYSNINKTLIKNIYELFREDIEIFDLNDKPS